MSRPEWIYRFTMLLGGAESRCGARNGPGPCSHASIKDADRTDAPMRSGWRGGIFVVIAESPRISADGWIGQMMKGNDFPEKEDSPAEALTAKVTSFWGNSKCWASTVGASLAGALAGSGAGAAVSQVVLSDDADSWKTWLLVIIGTLVGLVGGAAAGAALACWPDGETK